MKFDWNSTEINIDELIGCLSRREGIFIYSLPSFKECVVYEIKIDNIDESAEITIENEKGKRHRKLFSIS